MTLFTRRAGRSRDKPLGRIVSDVSVFQRLNTLELKVGLIWLQYFWVGIRQYSDSLAADEFAKTLMRQNVRKGINKDF